MGWDFCRNWKCEADVVRAILLDYPCIIDHELCGNVFWTLGGQRGDIKHIVCFLIEDNGCKAISAEMHPYYYNCPQRIVDATPADYAKPWKLARKENNTTSDEVKNHLRSAIAANNRLLRETENK